MKKILEIEFADLRFNKKDIKLSAPKRINDLKINIIELNDGHKDRFRREKGKHVRGLF